MLTPEAKQLLSKTIRDLRALLLDSIRAEAEGRYRLSLHPDKAGLSEEPRKRRERLEAWLDERVRATAPESDKERAAARERFLKEARMNRLSLVAILLLAPPLAGCTTKVHAQAAESACLKATPLHEGTAVTIRPTLESGTDCTIGATYQLESTPALPSIKVALSLKLTPFPDCRPCLEAFNPERARWFRTPNTMTMEIMGSTLVSTSVRVPARVRIACFEESPIVDAGVAPPTKP